MSTVGKRLVYQNAKAALQRAQLNPAKAVLSQSYLRLEANLSTTQSQYTFDLLVNENLNPAFATQNKLNLQDAFIASEIGIFLGLPASNASTETRVPIYSYPSPTVFTGAGVAAAMETVYTGSLSINVNQRTIMPSWDVKRHYYAPQTQATGAANSPIDQFDASANGFYPSEPNINLIGSKKNIVQITLGGTPAAITANSRLVLIFRGILAQNVTSVH